MKMIRNIKNMFWSSVLLLFLMSSTILMMPIASETINDNRIFSVIIGIVFWISGLFGYILVFLARKKTNIFLMNNPNYQDISNKKRGALTFCSDVSATVVDILAISSLLLLICLIINNNTNYIVYILISIFIFSLNMHFLFNGKIYIITKEKKRRVKRYEKK